MGDIFTQIGCDKLLWPSCYDQGIGLTGLKLDVKSSVLYTVDEGNFNFQSVPVCRDTIKGPLLQVYPERVLSLI